MPSQELDYPASGLLKDDPGKCQDDKLREAVQIDIPQH